MTAPRRRCGRPTIPAGGDPARVCPVCHGYIAEGQGIGIPYLVTVVCRRSCFVVANDLGRDRQGWRRGRWRPKWQARAAMDGARCAACREASE